jgi:hypothetical protein
VSRTFELDEALSKPLSAIPDDGFSHTVTLRLMEMRARRARHIMVAVAGGLTIVCLAMPFTPVGQAINRWALDLVQQISTPLAVIAGALVASALIVQAVSELVGTRPASRSRPSS